FPDAEIRIPVVKIFHYHHLRRYTVYSWILCSIVMQGEMDIGKGKNVKPHISVKAIRRLPSTADSPHRWHVAPHFDVANRLQLLISEDSALVVYGGSSTIFNICKMLDKVRQILPTSSVLLLRGRMKKNPKGNVETSHWRSETFRAAPVRPFKQAKSNGVKSEWQNVRRSALQKRQYTIKI
ncbi:hypothetical protein PanWU01x14_019300, partial [Parasponia andersonii]